jgi:hypothetical protein
MLPGTIGRTGTAGRLVAIAGAVAGNGGSKFNVEGPVFCRNWFLLPVSQETNKIAARQMQLIDTIWYFIYGYSYLKLSNPCKSNNQKTSSLKARIVGTIKRTKNRENYALPAPFFSSEADLSPNPHPKEEKNVPFMNEAKDKTNPVCHFFSSGMPIELRLVTGNADCHI